MATTKEYYEYIMECLIKVGDITSKKMMGEYCIYYQDKLVALLCDNRLLVKQTDTSKRLLQNCALEYPNEGSKTLMYVVEELENLQLMKELLEGLYKELPEIKKKSKS